MISKRQFRFVSSIPLQRHNHIKIPKTMEIKRKRKRKGSKTHLILLPSILIKSPIVVQNINKRQPVPNSDLVIVRIVRGRDLHRARAELHVDDDGVGDDGDAPREEGVGGEFAVEMLLSCRNRYWIWDRYWCPVSRRL